MVVLVVQEAVWEAVTGLDGLQGGPVSRGALPGEAPVRGVDRLLGPPVGEVDTDLSPMLRVMLIACGHMIFTIQPVTEVADQWEEVAVALANYSSVI